MSASSSFSLDDKHLSSTHLHTQTFPAIDLTALINKLKKTLLDEFNTILHQEISKMQAE